MNEQAKQTNSFLERSKNTTILILSIILIILLCCIIHNNITLKNIQPQIVTVHDTTIITKEQIKEKEKIKRVVEYDTFFIKETDTIRDTFYVSLPIEYKQYRDTFTTDTSRTILDIKYSGYKSSLDGVYVQSSFTQKERIKVKHTGFGQFIGVGLHLGYGASVNHIDKTFQPSPYIGVGVTIGWGYHWGK